MHGIGRGGEEWFRTEIGPRFGIGRIEPVGDAAFDARIEASALCDVSIMQVSAGPLLLERSQRDAGQSPKDWVSIGLVLSGSGVCFQNGREASLSPGDMVICESRKPFSLRFSETFAQLLISVPRALLGEANVEASTARAITTRRGVAGFAAESFTLLARRAEELVDVQHPFASHTAELLSQVMAELNAQTLEPSLTLRFVRAQKIIEDNLHNRAMTPLAIAQELRVSLRYLYKLFESHGESVCSYVRRKRLAACHAALTDPKWANQSIFEIACSFGFADASHFSRAFREAYGETPSDYRMFASAPATSLSAPSSTTRRSW